MNRLFACLLIVALVESANAAEPTYWQDVRPSCARTAPSAIASAMCASSKSAAASSWIHYDGVIKNTKKPLLTPGKSGDSFLIHIVTTTDLDKRMPLGGKPLPDDAIAVLEQWIDSGAKRAYGPKTIRPSSSPSRRAPANCPSS